MNKIKEYFTYQEILNLHQGVPTSPNQKSLSSTWFTTLIDSLQMELNVLVLDSSYNSQISDLVNALMTIVYDRHAEDYVFSAIYDCNESYTLTSNDSKKVLSKLINIINLTAPKYIPLFKQYKEASINPIDAIKSTSKGKTAFNDTPQNIGDWGDEDHTTNISSSESETSVDVGTLMERLASMYKDYKSVILEWSNEFNQCFIKEEQTCF